MHLTELSNPAETWYVAAFEGGNLILDTILTSEVFETEVFKLTTKSVNKMDMRFKLSAI